MQKKKRCTNCVLPETFPGIKLNEEGVCNFCQKYKGSAIQEEKKARYREKFKKLVKQFKGKGTYDALMSYSGGKDSTFTLAILKEKFGLNVLAVTLDHGFLPDRTFVNIKNVVESLSIDQIFFKPRLDTLKKIFVACSKENIYPPTTLTRASTICTSCMAIVKFNSLRLALEKDIPFIIFGWSPGQIPIASSIMKNNPQIVKLMHKSSFEPLFYLVGNEIRPYFLEEKHFKGSYFFPYNISPLAFFDYNEEEIYKKIDRLGWKLPDKIDANTTNCLLNSFANVTHRNKHGFHPYAFEMAKLVREGYMKRSTALGKLEQNEDSSTIELIKEKLGL